MLFVITDVLNYDMRKLDASGFGALRVSMPAEAVGFFRAKKSSACLPSEGK
jgi:hypothetical protein